MVIPKFFAKVSNNGEIIYKNQKGYNIWISNLAGKEVEVVIKEKKKTRSLNQNAWLWGVAYQLICREVDEGKERMHEILSAMFLKEDYWFKGKRFEVIRSTTDLSTKEFGVYMNRIQQWAAQELNIDIPSPNEVDYDSIIF